MNTNNISESEKRSFGEKNKTGIVLAAIASLLIGCVTGKSSFKEKDDEFLETKKSTSKKYTDLNGDDLCKVLKEPDVGQNNIKKQSNKLDEDVNCKIKYLLDYVKRIDNGEVLVMEEASNVANWLFNNRYKWPDDTKYLELLGAIYKVKNMDYYCKISSKKSYCEK